MVFVVDRWWLLEGKRDEKMTRDSVREENAGGRREQTDDERTRCVRNDH